MRLYLFTFQKVFIFQIQTLFCSYNWYPSLPSFLFKIWRIFQTFVTRLVMMIWKVLFLGLCNSLIQYTLHTKKTPTTTSVNRDNKNQFLLNLYACITKTCS